MNKNIFIALFFVLIIVLGGYFIWQRAGRQKPISAQTEVVMKVSPKQLENSAIQNNQDTTQANTSQITPQKADTIALKKSSDNPVNRQTYTNKRLGFTFQYPLSWSKNGRDADIINLSGVKTEVDINFIDTMSKTSLLIAYHLAPEGGKLYDYVSNQYHFSKGRFEAGGTQIQVGGKTAFESSTISSLNGRGKKLNPPLRVVIVDFPDYEQTGAIEFQFKTSVANEEAEVSSFNQLLSDFKFLSK